MSSALGSDPVPVFLSGAMGSGKSSVGKVVASRLGARFVDLDARIEEEQGVSVLRIFEERGEAAFREIERETIRRVITATGLLVVALGGGTVIDRATRRSLLDQGVLVTLRAPVAELALRVAGASGRPLLANADVHLVLSTLLAERASAYAECHGEIETAKRSIEDVADDVITMARERPVAVPLGARTYRVEIGRGILSRVGARLRAADVQDLSLVVTDANVEEPWARSARASVEAAGMRGVGVTLGPGERNKTLASVERIWNAALESGIDRHAAIVAVGGGVVGDLAAFAASTLLRGIALVQIPTSLLAMVDSSVGGKTGFDRAQGKNLIGTFHQPRAVLCDVDALSTLDPLERISGMAEVIKSAWIDGERAVAALEQSASRIAQGDPDATIAAIRGAVALKSRIVADDEHEVGPRALLNLGHTLGHAMEASSNYTMRHGDAVARGMVIALRIARALGHASSTDIERLDALLDAVGLPRDPENFLDPRALSFVSADKKRRGNRVRFVLPGAPGRVEIRPIPIDELVRLATTSS